MSNTPITDRKIRFALVGCGRIGRCMARMAGAFRMRVLAYDPHVASDELPGGVQRCDTLDALLRWDVEPWMALASLHTGNTSQHGLLHAAWKTLLRTLPHDTLCGCSVDGVARARHGVRPRADRLRQLFRRSAPSCCWLSQCRVGAGRSALLARRYLRYGADGRWRKLGFGSRSDYSCAPCHHGYGL